MNKNKTDNLYFPAINYLAANPSQTNKLLKTLTPKRSYLVYFGPTCNLEFSSFVTNIVNVSILIKAKLIKTAIFVFDDFSNSLNTNKKERIPNDNGSNNRINKLVHKCLNHLMIKPDSIKIIFLKSQLNRPGVGMEIINTSKVLKLASIGPASKNFGELNFGQCLSTVIKFICISSFNPQAIQINTNIESELDRLFPSSIYILLKDISSLKKVDTTLLNDDSSTIYIKDEKQHIINKITKAFYSYEDIESNPIVGWLRYIVFQFNSVITINRPQKWGGNVTNINYKDLCTLLESKKIHPTDVKLYLASFLISLVR